jgi:hypothetical protein
VSGAAGAGAAGIRTRALDLYGELARRGLGVPARERSARD